MIRVQDNAVTSVDVIATRHYDNLIAPINADGITYHATSSLIGRIASQRAVDDLAGLVDQVRFWDYFLDNDYRNLKRVIKGKPSVLKKVIGEITAGFGAGFLSDNVNYQQANLTDFGKEVKRVFAYKSLYRDHAECEANCRDLNLVFCPYCNENLVPVIVRTNGLTGAQEDMALLQIDHFYPRSRHPYLGLSFFNLVPGCAPCNAQLKGEKNFDIGSHFNPFHKRFDDFYRFELKNTKPKDLSEIQITYEKKYALPSADQTIKDFELVRRYEESHKRVLYKLVSKINNHKPKYAIEVKKQFPFLFRFPDASITDIIEDQNVPLQRKEINQFAIGKLKRDICIQMGALQ
jgi:hypothetical protein